MTPGPANPFPRKRLGVSSAGGEREGLSPTPRPDARPDSTPLPDGLPSAPSCSRVSSPRVGLLHPSAASTFLDPAVRRRFARKKHSSAVLGATSGCLRRDRPAAREVPLRRATGPLAP